MTEGELKKRAINMDNWQIGKTTISTLSVKDVVDWIYEAKKDMPKHYVYTDYTHDFGIDPTSKEFEAIKKEDYPKYVHIPDDEEWLKWAKKWVGK